VVAGAAPVGAADADADAAASSASQQIRVQVLPNPNEPPPGEARPPVEIGGIEVVSPSSESLAYTGANLTAIAILALALVAAGFLFLGASESPRRRAAASILS
jgi:hypothetical protein